MKELIFKTGGRPLFNDDLDILQSEVFGALQGLLKGLGKPAILSGCQINRVSGNQYAISEGLVYLDGQILRYDGTGDPSPENNIILSDNETSDPFYFMVRSDITTVLDKRTYKDGIEKEAIAETKAVLSSSQLPDREFIQFTTAQPDNFWSENRSSLSQFIESTTGEIDTCILSGLEITSITPGLKTNTAGLIYYKGQIYTVDAREGTTEALSEAGDPKLAILSTINRKMTLTTNDNLDGLVAYSTLERYDDIRRNKVFPKGTILHIKMKQTDISKHFNVNSGDAISKTWQGWRIDPDSKGRVIIGYDANRQDYNNINDKNEPNYSGYDKGGAEKVALSVNEMPSHRHSVTDEGHTHNYQDVFHSENTTHAQYNSAKKVPLNTGGSGGTDDDNVGFYMISTTTSNTSNISINNSGNNQPHENRQPYVVYLNVEKIA